MPFSLPPRSVAFALAFSLGFGHFPGIGPDPGIGPFLGLGNSSPTASAQELPRPPHIDPAGIPGSLVIAGGGRLPPEIRETFVGLAGGGDARLVIVPTASGRADDPDAADGVLDPWRELGPASLAILHTRDRDEADSEAFLRPLRQATGVWFGGGQQSRIADAYLGTGVERELHELLRRGGVIGGSSAGAAIQSRTMIAGGHPEPTLATGFDLLPGAIIDQHFLARKRLPRLQRAVARHPDRFGIGIDESTAVVVRGRDLRVIGKSSATLVLAEVPDPAEVADPVDVPDPVDVADAADVPVVAEVAASDKTPVPAAGRGGRPALVEAAVPGTAADLVALRRAAAFRSLLAGGPGSPDRTAAEASGEDGSATAADAFRRPKPPRVESGTLVIVGGGAVPSTIVSRMLQAAGGADAPVVILPTAVARPGGGGDAIPDFFRRAGCRDITVLPQVTRAEVESDAFLRALGRAQLVWFGGGRQWRFVDAYAGTKAEAAFRDVLRRGGVIAGSSAGATIQGDYLCRGNPLGNVAIMAEGYERGFSFLPGVAIDQHFSQRQRQRDMVRLVATYPQFLGIGIDEATALVVEGEVGEVVGDGAVYFFDHRHVAASGHPPLRPGHPRAGGNASDNDAPDKDAPDNDALNHDAPENDRDDGPHDDQTDDRGDASWGLRLTAGERIDLIRGERQ